MSISCERREDLDEDTYNNGYHTDCKIYDSCQNPDYFLITQKVSKKHSY